VVGETTVPAIGENDLLVAGPGSGETTYNVNVVKMAKKHKERIALITALKSFSLSKPCDIQVKIPASTKLSLKKGANSLQSMTNLFEQSLLINCDIVSIIIQNKLDILEDEMWKIHANLE